MDLDNDVVLCDSFSISLIRFSIFSSDSQSFWHKISSMDLYPPLPFNPSFNSPFNFFYVAPIFSEKIFASLFLLRAANYNSRH
jgi:hypothetical protein